MYVLFLIIEGKHESCSSKGKEVLEETDPFRMSSVVEGFSRTFIQFAYYLLLVALPGC